MKESYIKKTFPLFYAWAKSNYYIIYYDKYIELYIKFGSSSKLIEVYDEAKMIDKENQMTINKKVIEIAGFLSI